MHIQEKNRFDTSKGSEWDINIMFNGKDGGRGCGGTTSFKDDDFCDTYHNYKQFFNFCMNGVRTMI
eukprot:12188989-Ditylum_brightwellii.AAC.1